MTKWRTSGAFLGQRVTGQQRYAHEISSRLSHLAPLLSPPHFWRTSSPRSWLWTQAALTGQRRVLHLTSRVPAFAPGCVFTVHDLFVLTNPEWYSPAFVRLHEPLLRRSLRAARAVVVVSEPVRHQLLSSGLLSSQCEAVSLAPNAPTMKLTLDSQDVPPTPERPFLLAVASRDPRKGLSTLASAWEACPPALRNHFRLKIVGGQHASFAESRFEWPADVELLGYVTDRELASLYKQAWAVVIPSLAEGFGLPLVEAKGSGARVICSDIDIFRWVGGSDVDGYFDPGNIESLREALIAVMTTTDQPKEPARVLRFSWDRSAEGVIDLLSQLD